MTTHIRNSCILPALAAVLGLMLAGWETAQTFTTPYSPTALSRYSYTANGTNSDGATPAAGLITNSSGNTLYGTTFGGGTWGYGTVFKVNTDGTVFTNLHSFTAPSASPPYGNSDGTYPQAGLI